MLFQYILVVRAVSEQFQSSFSAFSVHFGSSNSSRAVSEQFQSSFSAFYCVRAVLEQFFQGKSWTSSQVQNTGHIIRIYWWIFSNEFFNDREEELKPMIISTIKSSLEEQHVATCDLHPLSVCLSVWLSVSPACSRERKGCQWIWRRLEDIECQRWAIVKTSKGARVCCCCYWQVAGYTLIAGP